MSVPQNLEVGVAVLSTQMLQLHTDVGRLQQELEDHRKEHAAQARDQAAARRRLWSAVVVLIGGIDGPLIALLLGRH